MMISLNKMCQDTNLLECLIYKTGKMLLNSVPSKAVGHLFKCYSQ